MERKYWEAASIDGPASASTEGNGRAAEIYVVALHSMHCTTAVTITSTADLRSSQLSDQFSIVSCRFSVGDAIGLPAGSSSEEQERGAKIARRHCTPCVALRTSRSPPGTTLVPRLHLRGG